jgi:hypothetical protein
MLETGASKGWCERVEVELCHCDLDVDDVLGSQAWHRGGADVADAQREIAEAISQHSTQRPELLLPGC